MAAFILGCWLVLLVTVLLVQQWEIRGHRCERCFRTATYLTQDGECVTCWEDSVSA